MAYIIVTDNNRKHLISRAEERFREDPAAASSHISRIISVLEKKAPDDWRFTRSPVAKFLVYDVDTGFRILGRTYRDVGSNLVTELETPTLDDQTVRNLADEYLRAIGKPDTRIVHELKTVYKARQDISELKHTYRVTRRELPHIVPIDAKRIAARPNAIIEDSELWVRQKELLSIEDSGHEYLLFERLTQTGIDKSYVRVYVYDVHGNIKHDGSMDYAVPCDPHPSICHGLPGNFHTESYWSLPTYLDAYYMDLDYKRRTWPASITDKEALLLLRMELINVKVREKLGFS